MTTTFSAHLNDKGKQWRECFTQKRSTTWTTAGRFEILPAATVSSEKNTEQNIKVSVITLNQKENIVNKFKANKRE